MNGIIPILRRLPALVLECLVRGYQVALSPLLIGSCKFAPSCSEYFIQAVREWGAVRGGWLGIRRLGRCHPFTRGGIDPVPRRRSIDRRTVGLESDPKDHRHNQPHRNRHHAGNKAAQKDAKRNGYDGKRTSQPG